MSFWTRVQTQLTDIDLIRDALAEIDPEIQLLEGKGLTVRGHSNVECEWVIRLRGHYDVGLDRTVGFGDQPFELVQDTYGGHVERELGEGCGRLLQEYAAAQLIQATRKQGMSVRRTKDEEGRVHLHVATT